MLQTQTAASGTLALLKTLTQDETYPRYGKIRKQSV